MPAHHGYSLDSGFKGLLASVGVRHDDVLRRTGLPADLLQQPHARVGTDAYFAFARAIQESVDDPRFALRLVEAVNAESFSPPVFAALCSPDLETAVTRLARFKPLIAPVTLESEIRSDQLTVHYEWADSAVGSPIFLSGSEALFLVKLARMGTRHHVEATAVTLRERPPLCAAFEAFLGCAIRQGSHLSVSFRLEDARRPFLTQHAGMWEIFAPQLRQRLQDLEDAASFASRTRAVLLEALPSGQASVHVVARRLGMSARTLQRRLRDEGTGFKRVVRETRQSLSEHYLGRTHLSYGEIACLLGFQEPTSFFRAFHDWTGTTPQAFRRSLRPGVPRLEHGVARQQLVAPGE